MDLKKGEKLVRLARNSVEAYFRGEKVSSKVDGDGGIFVTIHRYPSNELRGCIGFIDRKSLSRVRDAALSAAFFDSRFLPLKEGELNSIIFEVSILSELEEVEIKNEMDFKKIKIGRDGLVIEKNKNKGLLLPQVAKEHKWDVGEFLEYCCLKAGLSQEEWRDAKIFKFQCDVFKEEKPKGKIVKVK